MINFPNPKTRLVILFSLVLSFLLTPLAFAEDEVGFIKKAYQTLGQTRQTGTQLDPATMKQIRDLFDFSAFADKALIDIKGQMAPAEVEEFQKIFGEVFFNKIARKGIKISDKKLDSIQYHLDKHGETLSTASVTGTADKTQITLKFELKPAAGSWKIQDISVNGALLTRNYRGQFNRIYRVEGYTGLKGRMEKKL